MMITEDLQKYIEIVELEEANCMIHEMANIGPQRHGIENVYIFVGSVENEPHWLRVKISNTPGRYDRQNSFVIRMPSLDYDPRKVADWITPKIMNKILSWIKLNQEALYDYETGKVTDTDVFLNSLSRI